MKNTAAIWLYHQHLLSPSDSFQCRLTVEGKGEGSSGVKRFSPDQLAWLNKIKDQIAQNAEMTVDDFNYIPFNQEGGLLKVRELFGNKLEPLISELNGFLIA